MVLWKDTKHIKHLEELVEKNTVTYFFSDKIDQPSPKFRIIFAVADFNSKPKRAGNALTTIHRSMLCSCSSIAWGRKDLPSKTTYTEKNNKNEDKVESVSTSQLK